MLSPTKHGVRVYHLGIWERQLVILFLNPLHMNDKKMRFFLAKNENQNKMPQHRSSLDFKELS